MKIKCLTVGAYATNCYLLIYKDNSGYIIDPGTEGERIYKEIEKSKLKIKNIILTHGHFDHLGGLDFLKDKLKVEILIHSQDRECLVSPQKNLSFLTGSSMSFAPAEGTLEKAELNGFRVLYTPGHTPGSICLYNQSEKILISGDTIFNRGIGRTDFPGSNHQLLINSIQEKILILPDDVTVYPGHGSFTTIKEFKDFFAVLES